MPKKTARLIVENGGDYLIALKKNQQSLHLHATQLLSQPVAQLLGEIECGHGRIEQRCLRVAILDSDLSPFPHARQVLSCTRIYTPANGEAKQTETRYFITSLDAGQRSHQQLAAIIRGHWSVENLNHWKRDSCFWREDRSPLRSARGAKNLALLRNAALAILPFEQHSSLNAALDYYRDYRGQSLRLLKNAPPFTE